MVRGVSWELERPSVAPDCGSGKQGLPITGHTGKWQAATRESEGVVVPRRRRGTTQPGRKGRTPTSSTQALQGGIR